jgi:predicted DCC family thiol-disulfide oxidoreductase YuxK
MPHVSSVAQLGIDERDLLVTRAKVGIEGVHFRFPKVLRNAVYRLIAANRYRWFGKKSECWLPTPELKARFLD